MRRLALVLARSNDEEGMTLIELMAALIVLAIAVFAMSFLMGETIVGTLHSREREVAVALANQQVESARSIGYNNLALQSGTGVPTSYLDGDGKTYTTLISTGCTTCLPYTQTITQNGFTFTVKTIVMQIDDPADGTGANDADHQTVDYKRVAVEVSSADPPPFTYKTETIVHNTANDPVVPVQGIRVEVHDANNGDAIVTDDSYDWTITITGAGVLDDPVNEGVYENFGLAVGTYTCTVTNTTDTQDWYPQGTSAGTTSESFTCSVTTNTVATYAREWVQQADCTATAGATGRLWVNVTDQDGNPLSGATVDPAPNQGQTPDPAAATTGSNGDAVFDGVPVGDYLVSVSKTGYVTQSGLDACVFAQDPDDPQVSVALQPTPSGGTTATVNVNVTYTGGGTHTFKVALENGPQPYSSQQSMSKNQTLTYSFSSVAYGTYTVSVYCLKGKNFNLENQQTNKTFNVSSPAYTLTFSESKC